MSRHEISSTPRDMKVVGSERNNMSSRFYDIFMFEMTFYVRYGNSQSIGSFAGGELVASCGSPSWTTTE